MTYGTLNRAPTVNVESLDFVDVSIETRGDFLSPNYLNDFLNTPLGQAQTNLLNQQIREQGVVPNETTVRRALFAEQASQSMGYRRPDILTDNAEAPNGKMTESQLIAIYGPGAQKPGIMVDPAPVMNRNFGLA